MKARILRETDLSPDGLRVETFDAGAVVDLPGRRVRELARQGTALPLEGDGAALAKPDGDGLAAGVQQPAADEEVRRLHSKGKELLAKRKKAREGLQKAARKRQRLEQEQQEAAAAALLGDGTGGPKADAVEAARSEEEAAREKVQQIERALELAGERIEERLQVLERENAEAAAEAHRDLLIRTAEATEAAIEAHAVLRAFEDKHRAYLGNDAAAAPAVRDTGALEKFVEKAQEHTGVVA